jgi:hypothetical protein
MSHWQFKNPPDLSFFFPEVLPLMQTVPAGKKRATRLTGGERGPARGGVGSGRSWRSQRCTDRRRRWPESSGPCARRVISSAAGVPAKPRWSSSIKWHDELHGVTQRLCAQGIEEWSRDLPGLRSPAVGRSPATVDWLLRGSKVRFLARGASPRRAQSLPRVGRGWEGLCWPVYGGRVRAPRGGVNRWSCKT